VRFDVPQFDADKVKLGGSVRALLGGHTLSASVVRSTPGLVGQAHARFVEAKLELPRDADDALRAQLLPGAHVPIWLELDGRDDVVVIPRAAVTSTAGLSRVWLVEEHHLSERLLSVLRFEGDKVLVRSGLKPGDHLVLRPAPDFRIGQEVTP
jgi:HlyD family secretion protein